MRLWLLTLVAGLMAGPASACRLALLLALDVSSSVDAAEDRLQREGLARALDSPAVREAMLGPGPVALGVYEWSGKWQQDWLLPWTMIETGGDLDRAIVRLGGSVRVESRYPTALGYALSYAQQAFRSAPDCTFRTLDVSGDGKSNDGYPPSSAYKAFEFSDITVNGLVIGPDLGVRHYYENQVIRGPFAFVEQALDYADFQQAMERKLLRELEPRAIGLLQ